MLLILCCCRGFQNFYYALQQPLAAADISVLEAYQCVELRDRLSGLELAREFYEKSRDLPFHAAATAEQIQLLKFEQEVDKSLPKGGEQTSAVDLSVTQLMERLILRGDVRQQ